MSPSLNSAAVLSGAKVAATPVGLLLAALVVAAGAEWAIRRLSGRA